MKPRLSFVTLGVSDLPLATRFYEEALGLPRLKSPAGVSFFDLGAARLALYPRHRLAEEAGLSAGSGYSGFALAYNVGSAAEADRLLRMAGEAGGRITRAAGHTSWGGYAGYFADPDGFVWEVVWNPRLTPV